VVQGDLELEQLDVKNNILHGELEERICMKQLEGFVQERQENMVSSQEVPLWAEAVSQDEYKQFDSFMANANYTQCEYGNCVYIKQCNDDLTYLLLYVDDMLIAARNMTHIQKCKA